MIVLDASALVDELLGLPSKHWVLQQLSGHEVLAPAHQVAEVLSAVSRMERAGTLPRLHVEDVMTRAAQVDQHLVLPTSAHVRRAIELSDHVRVNDGLYVALAEEHGCPLVTTDRRLASARVDCEVRTPTAD